MERNWRGNNLMSTVSSVGKIAYIYKEGSVAGTGTWHPIAGYANTTAPYSWSGTHNFTNTVTFDSVLNAKFGINNFQSPADRDLAIPITPTTPNGIVVFVRQTNEGQLLNQIQYLHNSQWRVYGDNAQLTQKLSNFTLSLADAGRTVDIDASSNVTVTIPANIFLVGTQIAFIRSGIGQVVFEPGSGVTLRSKNNNRKIAAQWSPATLIQKSANTWILIGDLTA
jgi:hypothetical protein